MSDDFVNNDPIKNQFVQELNSYADRLNPHELSLITNRMLED